jgi:hypothetical protein
MTKSRDDIFAEADGLSGRYLLPKRYSRPLFDEDKEERDHQYDACETLVQSGHARWIPSWSNMAPGVELTGKPLSET